MFKTPCLCSYSLWQYKLLIHTDMRYTVVGCSFSDLQQQAPSTLTLLSPGANCVYVIVCPSYLNNLRDFILYL
jgi:hypothetical protein